MEKLQFPTVKQERQLTQSRQRWEQPNTGRRALNHRTHFGEEKTAHGWLSLSGPTSVYGKIAVSHCKIETPAHSEPATMGTTQHRQSREHSTTELTLERSWLSLSGPTSVYGKIAVSHCKTRTPAHTEPATLGTTQHRQNRVHSTTELTLERRKLHKAGSAYPVLPVSMAFSTKG